MYKDCFGPFILLEGAEQAESNLMSEQNIFDTSGDTVQLKRHTFLKQIDPPQTTFFYVRRDGSIFSCGEQEASYVDMFYKTFGNGLWGVSDGSTYANLMLKARDWQNEQLKELEVKKRRSKVRIRMLERKARLTKKEESELEGLYDLEDNYDTFVDKVMEQVRQFQREAWEAEKMAAKGNFKKPSKRNRIIVADLGEQSEDDGLDDIVKTKIRA